MARPKATQAQKDAVQLKIRQAAADLYREQGVANLTARAIAQRAGVSVGTIYVHFGSLSSLARSLWQGPVERFEQQLKDIAQRVERPVDRVRALLEAYLQFARANPEVYRGAFLFVRPLAEEAPPREPFATSTFAALLIDAIEAGCRAGDLAVVDVPAQAQFMWASLHGHIALPINLDRFEWAHCSDQVVVDGLLARLDRRT
ncbi:MAG: TetR/AcrR family transcriptional regulator [Pseudomonadota bacterium]